MIAEPLTLATTDQRRRYREWAEGIARRAESNRVADRFQSYADAASDDGSFYGSTQEYRRFA